MVLNGFLPWRPDISLSVEDTVKQMREAFRVISLEDRLRKDIACSILCKCCKFYVVDPHECEFKKKEI